MEIDAQLKQQDMERNSLQSTVSDIQAALLFSNGEKRQILELALRNASSRLGAIEKKIEDLSTRREIETREELARVVSMANNESRLSTREKEEYSGFLKEDFFTKSDFGSLDHFYRNSWARLSEEGKNQMSARIWKGVRKGEYRFDELPPAVREKEMLRAHERLQVSSIQTNELRSIPEKDRQDFNREYEAGRKDEAAKVLERDSFKQTMFRERESKEIRSNQAVKEPDGATLGKKIAESASPSPVSKTPMPTEGDLDLAGVHLAGLNMKDSEKAPSVADMPQKSANAAVAKDLVRGG